MSARAAALAYAARGFPVFPCRATSDKAKGSKAPHVPGETAPGAQDGGHWLASTEAGTVSGWWQRWPDALIGFPTGRRSGTVVIDLDPRDVSFDVMFSALETWCGGGVAGVDSETGEIIPPACVRTQSGGLHLYFAYPALDSLVAASLVLHRRGEEGIGDLTNKANLFRQFLAFGEAPAELAHIDVRGEGGYVIAPPSVMDNGAAYTWVRRPEKHEDGRWRLPPVPPRLLAVMTREWLPAGELAAMAARSRAAQRFSGKAIDDAAVRRYVEKKVSGVLATLRGAAPGSRNQVLFWAAARLGEMVRGGVLGGGEAESLLIGNLPGGVPANEPKALKTIRSGLANSKFPAFSPAEIGGR